jgi:hypothetical protein
MDHFAGLDVSVKDTSVCIVDDTGKIVPSPPWLPALTRRHRWRQLHMRREILRRYTTVCSFGTLGWKYRYWAP